MKIVLVILVIATFSIYCTKAQIVHTSPSFPTGEQAVTITYNAALGSGGLKDYEGDIYAHTGLITSNSDSESDWKYVQTNWAENTPETKLSKVGDNLYTLTITPSIIEYYEVDPSDEILRIALVFRNEDGSITGKTDSEGDIFIDVFTNELSVKINDPEQNSLLKMGESKSISISSNFADTIALFINGIKIKENISDTLTYTWTPETKGNYSIKATASNSNSSAEELANVLVYDSTPTAELPDNLRYGINYPSDTEATLVIYAPGKENIIVLGDFNNWIPKQEYIMNRTSDSTTFWITIDGLIPKQEYAFQYLIDGTLLIADPYSEKLLDPWYDKDIPASVYPNLKAYPEGETNNIVSVLQTDQVTYSWEIEDFEMPEKEKLIIYEMHIRDFVETHSYKTIADTLNYLQKLGINALELMPINEFEGNSSWGYNPSFYFAPDKYYGPKDDLKKLVDECHKQGIAVLIDLVLNHSFGQSPLVRMYFENGKPTPNNPWYNIEHNFTNTEAQWGYDFNHESKQTQNFVDSVNAFWMEEYKIDGFRFDFTKGFGNNIKDGSDEWGSIYDANRIYLLKRMASEIWKRKPQAFVSFEHLSENSEEKALSNHGIYLWGNQNRAYTEASMGYNTGSKSDFSWIDYQKRDWNDPHVIGYMESHDEERMMYKNVTWGNSLNTYNIMDTATALLRSELAANFFIPIPGPKLIWQFGELGYDISIDNNGRVGEKPIRWDYFNETNRLRLYSVYCLLNKLKNNEPAFATNNYTLKLSGTIKSIQLNHSDMNVYIVGNFDVEQQRIELAFQHTGTWHDLYSGNSLEVADTAMAIILKPGEYRFYTSKKLETPSLPEHEPSSVNFKNSISMYPNPVNNIVNFSSDKEIIGIEIINSSGMLILKEKDNAPYLQISIDDIDQGIYIAKILLADGLCKAIRFFKI